MCIKLQEQSLTTTITSFTNITNTGMSHCITQHVSTCPVVGWSQWPNCKTPPWLIGVDHKFRFIQQNRRFKSWSDCSHTFPSKKWHFFHLYFYSFFYNYFAIFSSFWLIDLLLFILFIYLFIFQCHIAGHSVEHRGPDLARVPPFEKACCRGIYVCWLRVQIHAQLHVVKHQHQLLLLSEQIILLLSGPVEKSYMNFGNLQQVMFEKVYILYQSWSIKYVADLRSKTNITNQGNKLVRICKYK